MPFTMPNFQPLSPEQVSPLYGAISGLLRGVKEAPEVSQNITKAKYANAMAQQDLQNKILTNKYFGPEKESEIGLRGAQATAAAAAARASNVASQQNQLFLNILKQRTGQGGAVPTNQMPNTSTNNMNSTGQTNSNNPQWEGYLGPGTGTDAGGNGYEVQGGDDTGGEGYDNQNNNQMPDTYNTTPEASAGQSTGQQHDSNIGLQSIYGIPTPTPTTDDIINQKFFGIDTFKQRSENAVKQQQDQYDQYQKKASQTSQMATEAAKTKQIFSMFNAAMDRSSYKGHLLGHIPSSGIGSMAMIGPNDNSPEQQADWTVSNMMPGAMTQIRQAMGDGKFSVLDAQMSHNLIASRTMNDETRKNATDWVNGVSDRMGEMSKFYEKMSDPHSGAMVKDADQLWSNYQNQFPLVEKDGQTFNKDNLGLWKLYTTPEAIASVKANGEYVPSKKLVDSYKKIIHPDQSKDSALIAAITKGKNDSNNNGEKYSFTKTIFGNMPNTPNTAEFYRSPEGKQELAKLGLDNSPASISKMIAGVGLGGLNAVGSEEAALPNALKEGSNYLNTGKRAEAFRGSLGQGTSTQNIEAISKDLKNTADTKTEKALTTKDKLFSQEGESKLFNDKSESSYLSDPNVDKYYDKDTQDLHNKFAENPTLNNYDNLQSALKSDQRLFNKAAKRDPHSGRLERSQLNRNIENLDKDQQNFSQKLPENLQNVDKDWRNQWKTEVRPYTDAGKTIEKLSKGNYQEVSPQQLEKAFTYNNAKTRKVLSDMSPETSKKILYNALQKVKPGDAEGMANTLLELHRTKGYEHIVDDNMLQWAKSIKRAGHVKSALLSGGGALVGHMTGVPGAELAGAALPYATHAAHLISKMLKKK